MANLIRLYACNEPQVFFKQTGHEEHFLIFNLKFVFMRSIFERYMGKTAAELGEP